MSDASDEAVGALRVDVRRGDPTEEELAAVIAVVTESYAREASSAIAEEPSASPWAVSARGLRPTLHRDVPWGRFAG